MRDYIGFFEEKTGVLSWTRLMMSIIIAVALIIGLFESVSHVYYNTEIHETLILGMLGIATGGKVGQKFAEKKN
jgi:uncharacterized membrane protein YfcA